MLSFLRVAVVIVSPHRNRTTTKTCGDGKGLIKVKIEKNDSPTFQVTQINVDATPSLFLVVFRLWSRNSVCNIHGGFSNLSPVMENDLHRLFWLNQ